MQNKMETKIMKVVRQGEAFSVPSQKSESGQIQKCYIVLRELGGSKFENEFACSMLGSLAAPARFSRVLVHHHRFQRLVQGESRI